MSLRDFPSVEILSGDKALSGYVDILTKPLVVQTIKTVIADMKKMEITIPHIA